MNTYHITLPTSADPSTEGVTLRGDIVVSGHRSANPCVQTGCKWPKSADGKVYIPYVINPSYSKKLQHLMSTIMSSLRFNLTSVLFFHLQMLSR